ncbi:ATP synthase epsilon chain [Durusdinium trenchii]|uniref:Chloroplastic n=1 Tax=Durusdinium trenchii TaxID=1381693 RepID=A0ABP0MCS4_9DINO
MAKRHLAGMRPASSSNVVKFHSDEDERTAMRPQTSGSPRRTTSNAWHDVMEMCRKVFTTKMNSVGSEILQDVRTEMQRGMTALREEIFNMLQEREKSSSSQIHSLMQNIDKLRQSTEEGVMNIQFDLSPAIQEMQRLEEKQVEARRLLEEKVEKVSQQLAQVQVRADLEEEKLQRVDAKQDHAESLLAGVQRSQDMLAVSLESASDEAARHRAKAAEENAELVKLSHHLGRQFHQRLQEPVHVDFGEVLREVKKTHSAVSSDFRMVLGEIGKIQQALHLDFVLLVRFEDTLVAPPTQRVTRDISVVRLPRLYFCPADRYRHDRLIWNSYDCSLNYKTESDKCSARIQHFGGEEPETFKHGANWSSACLEFGTHKIGVKQEWSAAWNEISLKAAFLLPAHGDTKDVFQEIELGYLPKEWEVGEAPSTIEHYYAPLIRVPIFQPPLDSHASDGIATRMYLAEQEDHGRHEAGDFWYVYGASSMPVVNATMPEYRFFEKDGEWVRAPKSRRALAHIVITLEDFTKYEYRVQPVIYPLLSLFSQVSGVCALFCWAFFKSPLMGRKLIAEAEEGPSPVSEAGRRPGRVATHQGAEYRTIADALGRMRDVKRQKRRSNRACSTPRLLGTRRRRCWKLRKVKGCERRLTSLCTVDVSAEENQKGAAEGDGVERNRRKGSNTKRTGGEFGIQMAEYVAQQERSRSPAKDYDEPVSHTSLPPAAEAPAPTAAAVVAVQSAVLGSPMGMEKAHPSTPRKSVRHCATSPGLADKGPNPLGTESENGSSLGLSEGLPFTSAKRGATLPGGLVAVTSDPNAISRGRLKRVREFWCQTEPPPVEETAMQTDPVKFENKKGKRIPIPEPKKSTKPAKKEAVLGDGENRRRRNSFEQVWDRTDVS